jgi:type VI secretion system protein ImpK
MTSHDPERSFLLTAFREFYAEMSRLRRHIQADPWPAGAGGAEGDARPDAPRLLSARLAAVVERQALEAVRTGGEVAAALYREAQYVMAAVGDETFLHLDWWGRAAWQSHLLEDRLFGTQVAGERVFQRIDELLRDRDAARRDLAAVYLMALSLGFQGRYRGTASLARVEAYRRELFAFVFRRHPSLARGERRLFPQAYENTLRDRAPLPPRGPGRWTAIVAGVAALYLIVSTLMWNGVARPVAASADAVVNAVSDQPAGAR